MSLSYSNKFFLKPIEGSKRAKIFQRIIVNRQKAEIYTGIEIENRLWEEAAQRTKGNAAVNKRLSEKESELHNLISELLVNIAGDKNFHSRRIQSRRIQRLLVIYSR